MVRHSILWILLFACGEIKQTEQPDAAVGPGSVLDCSKAAGGNVPLHASCAGQGSGVGAPGGNSFLPAIVSHCSLKLQ